ncbi:MAG TPA: prepilin-type N-terminal cleavage/methylation domain-containing protein [Pseudidiomarina sp.]|nr:prepilin-type N-terminal cleavage/methylation domain-containing protein [Pseudidiomarina sp.]
MGRHCRHALTQRTYTDRQHGFTLVETLISLVLISLVMLSAAMAYQYFTQNWQRNQSNFLDVRENYRTWQLVHQVTDAIYPKVVFDDNQVPGFYFLGRDDGFTGVASISAQDPSTSAVFRIFREPNQNNGFRLVYEEATLGQQALQRAGQTLPFNFRRILIENAASISFRYQGWQNIAVRSRAIAAEGFEERIATPEWFSDYDGMERSLHPLAIEINAAGVVWFITLPDSAVAELSRYTSDV